MQTLYKHADVLKTQCPKFLMWLMERIDEENSVLDIGCGDKWYHLFLQSQQITSVDSWSKAKPSYLIDLSTEDLPFSKRSFDIVLILDFIEHLEKKRGEEILKQAIAIAKEKVILLTPLIWETNSQSSNIWYIGCPDISHKSLWAVKDFKGWRETLLACFNSKNKKEYFLGELYV